MPDLQSASSMDREAPHNCLFGGKMSRSPQHILESVQMAKKTMAALHDRALNSGSIDDRCELSVLQTTVRKIEERLKSAAEYDDILLRQLARTNARIDMPSS
jgi:hypothetical protein